MTSVIVDTSDLTEDQDEFGDTVMEDIAATAESDHDAKIEFHVQMRSWTLRDMESLIVEAAAMQLVGKIDRPTDLAKQIEARARQMLVEKADERLSAVTAEIIDQPVTPNYGDKKPVTMREMIGLYGREYLTQIVGNDGNPIDNYYAHVKKTRMAYLVEKAVDGKFKREIEAATTAAVLEIQTEIRAKHKAMIEAEKARIRDAFAREVAPK